MRHSGVHANKTVYATLAASIKESRVDQEVAE